MTSLQSNAGVGGAPRGGSLCAPGPARSAAVRRRSPRHRRDVVDVARRPRDLGRAVPYGARCSPRCFADAGGGSVAIRMLLLTDDSPVPSRRRPERAARACDPAAGGRSPAAFARRENAAGPQHAGSRRPAHSGRAAPLDRPPPRRRTCRRAPSGDPGAAVDQLQVTLERRRGAAPPACPPRQSAAAVPRAAGVVKVAPASRRVSSRAIAAARGGTSTGVTMTASASPMRGAATASSPPGPRSSGGPRRPGRCPAAHGPAARSKTELRTLHEHLRALGREASLRLRRSPAALLGPPFIEDGQARNDFGPPEPLARAR